MRAGNHLATMAKKINSQKTTCTIPDAVEKTLEEHEKPMHYTEVTDLIVKTRLYKPNTQTPSHSVHSAIWSDIRKKAVSSRFVFENGIVSLRRWGSLLSQQANKHILDQREELLSALKEMDCYQFEKFIADVVLPGMGFSNCTCTQKSRDGGYDGTGELTVHDHIKIEVKIQAKRYKKYVPVNVIRELRGIVHTSGAHKGLIITTGRFSDDTREEAKKGPSIALIDGSQLADILLKIDWPNHVSGLEKETIHIVNINKEDIKNYGMNADSSALS